MISLLNGWIPVQVLLLLLDVKLKYLVLYLVLGGSLMDGVPSHPLSIWPLRNKASLSRSGSRPLRSSEAKQPWKPSLEATSLGRLLYMPGPSPAMKRSPGGRPVGGWLFSRVWSVHIQALGSEGVPTFQVQVLGTVDALAGGRLVHLQCVCVAIVPTDGHIVPLVVI